MDGEGTAIKIPFGLLFSLKVILEIHNKFFKQAFFTILRAAIKAIFSFCKEQKQ